VIRIVSSIIINIPMSIEDQFLSKLALGYDVSQDEYDQMCQDLPLEIIAEALARRFRYTNQIQALIEAARLYAHTGLDYQALEICSRYPRVIELKKILLKSLPHIRKEYPGIRLVGKLLEEAFLVIDLETGEITRFPPLIPATII
jgi:hypothetical protein